MPVPNRFNLHDKNTNDSVQIVEFTIRTKVSTRNNSVAVLRLFLVGYFYGECGMDFTETLLPSILVVDNEKAPQSVQWFRQLVERYEMDPQQTISTDRHELSDRSVARVA